ncbi:MAG: CPBP family intramembrane metalloprotease [Bacteroidetes bacterium]|nr:MAG: CPBP family intramembrane metalloprotease [Bacteroidota bacterium]
MFIQMARQGVLNAGLVLATLFIVFFGYFAGQIPLTVLLIQAGNKAGLSATEMNEALEKLNLSAFGLSENEAMFWILLSFVGGMIALWFCVTRLHRRPFKTLITPHSSVNWSKILFAFGLWMALTLAGELVFYALNPDNYQFQFEAKPFAVLLIMAVFLFPIQTSFEELLFRGYLLQVIGVAARNRWVPLLLTSVGFGLMHIMNPEIAEFGMAPMMTYYIGVGLFLGVLTLLDDSLELALGIHAATNIYSAVFVTFDQSAISTPALFRLTEVDMPGMLFAFFISAGLFFWIVSRKFGLRSPAILFEREDAPAKPTSENINIKP